MNIATVANQIKEMTANIGKDDSLYWKIQATVKTLKNDLKNTGLFNGQEIEDIAFYVEFSMNDSVAEQLEPVVNRLLKRFNQ